MNGDSLERFFVIVVKLWALLVMVFVPLYVLTQFTGFAVYILLAVSGIVLLAYAPRLLKWKR